MTSKMVISPGQGLLMLIDHYNNDALTLEKLKKFYLRGPDDSTEADELKALLKEEALAHYQVSYDAKTINDDPTRRYFETHLAYESLANNLDKLSKSDLDTHFNTLKNRLLPAELAEIDHVLEGEFREMDMTLFKEYADTIGKIKSGALFNKLSPDNKEKTDLLVKCALLGVVNAWYTNLPLDIYGTGIYAEHNKGKVLLANQETTRNANLGLMKGHMPLAKDDIATSESPLPYLKPSDQSTFVEHSQWGELNFSKMVHPFSNSISGTMLCQLRTLAELKNKNGVFTESAEKMEQYTKALTSAMLFSSGGHTLNEFTAPLAIPAVRKEFSSVEGFDKITLESMFLNEGLNTALDATIDYNKMTLMRRALHEQVTGHTPIEPINSALSALKFAHIKDAMVNTISVKKDAYDEHVKNQWFSSSRAGSKKNVLIQVGLAEVIADIHDGNLAKAQTTIAKLKSDLDTQFGSKNFWGQPSESYKLVDSIEQELNHLHDNVHHFRDELAGLRSHKSQPELKNEIEEEEAHAEGVGAH